MARKLHIGFVGLGRVFDLNARGYLPSYRRQRSPGCASAIPPCSPAAPPSTRTPLPPATSRSSCAPISYVVEILCPIRCTRR